MQCQSHFGWMRVVDLGKKVKLVIVVEGDPKAPFSIATTLRCKERALLHFRQINLVTLFEGDPKAPFSIATTLRCKERALFHFRQINLVTLFEGDPKAFFSIATTLRCRRGRFSIPRIAPLYPLSLPDTYLIMLRVKQPIFLREKGVQTFSTSISSKVNQLVWQKIELACYMAAVSMLAIIGNCPLNFGSTVEN